MKRLSKLLVAFAALLGVLATGVLSAVPAQAHFFHPWRYGYAWGGPWVHPRPWFYPRIYYVPPPPPVYVAPRIAFVPPPTVYGYAWHYRYGYRLHHYSRHVRYKHVVHTAAVHHHWCKCGCCR